MKKVLALISGLFMIFALTGCGSHGTSGSKDADGAKGKGGTLTVGFDAGFPPFGFKDDATGEYKGFDLDAAKEVAKRAGLKYGEKAINWDSKDAELNSGQIDCIWNGFTMTGREDNYTFSKAYGNDPIIYLVKAGSGIKDVADLKDKRALVQADSSGLQALKSPEAKNVTDSFKSLQEVPDYMVAFQNLESGAAEVIVIDKTAAKDIMKKRGADKYEILKEPLKNLQYGIGFKKGNTELRDKVQKALDEMKKDGTLKKLAEKWDIADVVILD